MVVHALAELGGVNPLEPAGRRMGSAIACLPLKMQLDQSNSLDRQ